MFGYKQSRRRDDDIAIVNAGFRVHLKENTHQWKIRNCSLCYGGMSITAKFASQTEELLKGRSETVTQVEL